MRSLFIGLTLIIVGQQLCRYIFNLAGKSPRSSSDDKPKTVKDFMRDLSSIEMPDENKQRACQIFRTGTEHLFKGQIEEARRNYRVLEGDPYNLADKSNSLIFNLNLLKKQDKK